MRVLHVITGLAAGGAEQQLASILEHTSHDAAVVTMYNAGSVADRLRQRGIDVVDLDRRAAWDPRALTGLVALMRRRRPDVVHTHLYRAQLHGRVAARLAGVPVIVSTEHSLGASQIEGRRLTPPVRLLYLLGERMGQHTVAVSPVTRDRLRAWGVPDERTSVLPNGVDTHRFAFDPDARARTRATLGVASDDVVVGAVGRLHAVKRFDLLLDVLADLADPRLRLVLVGRGDHGDALRARARHLGLDRRVRFLGERADVPALLSAMDVYAAPSREETFGLAVIEALCAGLPAVVGACPAVDGLALDSVRRCHDRASLRAGLVQLTAGAVRVASPLSRPPPPVIVETFDIERIVVQLDRLYQHVGDRTLQPA